MTKPRKTSVRRRAWLALGVFVLLVALGGAVFARLARVQRVEVVGARHAVPQEVVSLSGVQAGERLFATDDATIEDRAGRHPWVRRARATRLPSGVVRLAVEERTPVALVLDGEGRAKAYLDAEGHAMPVLRVEPYDVPIVHGRVLPENLTAPAPLTPVRELAASLASLSDDAHALVSDFSIDRRGDVTLRTVAAPGGEALRVRLGRGNFEPKFDALVRFWQHAVLPRPTHRYDVVDLRFAGQIVTREARSGEAMPDSLRADSTLRARRDSLAALATAREAARAAAARAAASPAAPSTPDAKPKPAAPVRPKTSGTAATAFTAPRTPGSGAGRALPFTLAFLAAS